MSGKQQKNTNSNKVTIPKKYFGTDGGVNTYPADAPYNFISLPTDICAPHAMWEDVVATTEDLHIVSDIYDEYIQTQGKHSGYIELTITTKQDTLVGMPGKTDRESTFFSIKNNEPMIPGSSLRGMTRNLFKIMTASSFRSNEDFNERVLYYRDIASRGSASELKNEYERNHTGAGDDTIRGGFIVRVRTHTGDTKWYAYNDPTVNLTGEKLDGTIDHPMVNWKCFTEAIETLTNTGNRKAPSELTCSIRVNQIGKKPTNTYTVRWNSDEYYEIDESIIRDYLGDERRGGNSINLLYPQRSKDVNGVSGGALESSLLGDILGVMGADMIAPCFFVVDPTSGKVKNFGHTKYYRIPYNFSIADHVPSNLRTNRVDFTDLVFGLKEFWGGRVYFGDAVHTESSDKGIYQGEPLNTILLGPNPTSFQLYLAQKGTDKRLHWNDKSSIIRGVKYYWHRNSIEVYEPEKKNGKDINSNILTQLSNIVKRDNTFVGKVYFNHLTTEELGALCKVLFTSTENSADKITRKKGRRFKIGKGKSMGLGSVDIQSKLFLEAEDAYTNESIWSDTGVAPLHEEISLDEGEHTVDSFIASFDTHTKNSMSEVAHASLETGVEDLVIMMDSGGINPAFDSRTVHMTIENDPANRFKERIALLEPKEFKGFK